MCSLEKGGATNRYVSEIEIARDGITMDGRYGIEREKTDE
jgi:hypothetical protein